MGVLPCYRKNCDSIMCDTYVNDVGYICDDCKKEFAEYLTKENIEVKNEGEIRRELPKFMATDKDCVVSGEDMDVDAFFEKHTRK